MRETGHLSKSPIGDSGKPQWIIMKHKSKLKDRVLRTKYEHSKKAKYSDNREYKESKKNFKPYELVNAGHKAIDSVKNIYKNIADQVGQEKTAKSAYKQAKYLLKQKKAELKAAKLDAKIGKLKKKH